MAIIAEGYDSLWPIYQDRFYWIMLSVTMVLTFGVNYGVDYGMQKDHEQMAVINGSGFGLNVLVVTVIICFLIFFGGGGIRDRIVKGDARPVKQVVLCNTLLKRILFFSLAEPRWQDRFPKFLAQTLFFPGCFVVIIVYMLCWFVNGCTALQAEACTTSLHMYLVYTELWKATIAGVMFTMNYAAFHNDAQPELLDAALLNNEHAPLVVGTAVSSASMKEQPEMAPSGYRAAGDV